MDNFVEEFLDELDQIEASRSLSRGFKNLVLMLSYRLSKWGPAASDYYEDIAADFFEARLKGREHDEDVYRRLNLGSPSFVDNQTTSATPKSLKVASKSNPPTRRLAAADVDKSSITRSRNRANSYEWDVVSSSDNSSEMKTSRSTGQLLYATSSTQKSGDHEIKTVTSSCESSSVYSTVVDDEAVWWETYTTHTYATTTVKSTRLGIRDSNTAGGKTLAIEPAKSHIYTPGPLVYGAPRLYPLQATNLPLETGPNCKAITYPPSNQPAARYLGTMQDDILAGRRHLSATNEASSKKATKAKSAGAESLNAGSKLEGRNWNETTESDHWRTSNCDDLYSSSSSSSEYPDAGYEQEYYTTRVEPQKAAPTSKSNHRGSLLNR